MKHSVFPNRASAFYSVLICRGQFECWPGRADQVVSLQASRMRQLFKSSCLDLQFQPVGIASKGCFPAPGNAVASTPTDEQEHSSSKKMQMQGKKKKKSPVPRICNFLAKTVAIRVPTGCAQQYMETTAQNPSMASK